MINSAILGDPGKLRCYLGNRKRFESECFAFYLGKERYSMSLWANIFLKDTAKEMYLESLLNCQRFLMEIIFPQLIKTRSVFLFLIAYFQRTYYSFHSTAVSEIQEPLILRGPRWGAGGIAQVEAIEGCQDRFLQEWNPSRNGLQGYLCRRLFSCDITFQKCYRFCQFWTQL